MAQDDVLTLVTGDLFKGLITLTKKGVTFVIPTDATVKAAVVRENSTKKLSDEQEQDSGAPGADWSNSLVVVSLPVAITENIKEYGPALLEIQVDDDGPLTWKGSLEVVQGLIE